MPDRKLFCVCVFPVPRRNVGSVRQVTERSDIYDNGEGQKEE